jgi:hypothetical protein
VKSVSLSCFTAFKRFSIFNDAAFHFSLGKLKTFERLRDYFGVTFSIVSKRKDAIHLKKNY